MRDYRVYLDHIIECIEHIEEYCAAGEDDFMASQMIQDACMRNLQVLSQSSMRLTDEMRSKCGNVNWDQIRGFRNRLVHEYFELSLNQIWDVISVDLPHLKRCASTLLKELGG